MAVLYLICDLSGSMFESGKRFVVRNMVRTVDQYFRLKKGPEEIRLVAWSDTAKSTGWTPGQEYPNEMLECRGSSSGEALAGAVSPAMADYAIVFTDGHWSPETRKQVGSLSRSMQNGHFRIIRIGEDADSRLKGPSVFDSENLLAALHGWIT